MDKGRINGVSAQNSFGTKKRVWKSLGLCTIGARVVRPVIHKQELAGDADEVFASLRQAGLKSRQVERKKSRDWLPGQENMFCNI